MKKVLTLPILVLFTPKKMTPDHPIGVYLGASLIEASSASVGSIILASLFKTQLSKREWRQTLAAIPKKVNFLRECKSLVPTTMLATFIMTSGQKKFQNWIIQKQNEQLLSQKINPKQTSVMGTAVIGALLGTVARNVIISHYSKNKQPLHFLLTGANVTIFRDIFWLAAVTNTADPTTNESIPQKILWNTLAATITQPADLVARWMAGNHAKVGNKHISLVFKQLKKYPSSIFQGLGWRAFMLNCSAFGFDSGLKLCDKASSLIQSYR